MGGRSHLGYLSEQLHVRGRLIEVVVAEEAPERLAAELSARGARTVVAVARKGDVRCRIADGDETVVSVECVDAEGKWTATIRAGPIPVQAGLLAVR